MTEAYKAVKRGELSVTKAALLYGVPEQTLRDRVKGRVSIDTTKSGTGPLFNVEEEAKLVDHLHSLARNGYGFIRQEVVEIANDYSLQLGKRETGKKLTLNWYRNFLSRWPILEAIKLRTSAAQNNKSEAAVDNYFEDLDGVFTKHKLEDQPHLIFGVDEIIIETEGKATTILGCGNASGQAMPPFFIFTGNEMMPELLKNALPGTAGAVTETGLSNFEVFRKYLQEHFMKFLPQRQSDQYVLLLLDGHNSHVAVDLVEWAKENGIILFYLPAVVSHVLQPLHMEGCGPLQQMYSNLKPGLESVVHEDVCSTVCKEYSEAFAKEKLQIAFRQTGLYPFDRNIIGKSIFWTTCRSSISNLNSCTVLNI